MIGFYADVSHQKVFAERWCGTSHPLALNVNVNIQTMQWKWFRLQLNILLQSLWVLGASYGKTDDPGKMNSSRQKKKKPKVFNTLFFTLIFFFLESPVSISGSVTVLFLLHWYTPHTSTDLTKLNVQFTFFSGCSDVFQVTEMSVHSPVYSRMITDKNETQSSPFSSLYVHFSSGFSCLCSTIL